MLAPARFLPPAVRAADRAADGTLVLDCVHQGHGSVWRFDSRRRVVLEAHAEPPGSGGQGLRLLRLYGAEVLDTWSDEVAATIGHVLVSRRGMQAAMTAAAGYVVESMSARTVLQDLVEGAGRTAGLASTGPVDFREDTAARCGDRIAWTTPLVDGRLGVLFHDHGSSQYLGAGFAGAVIEAPSGRITHSVEGPNAGGTWFVKAYVHPGDA